MIDNKNIHITFIYDIIYGNKKVHSRYSLASKKLKKLFNNSKRDNT